MKELLVGRLDLRVNSPLGMPIFGKKIWIAARCIRAAAVAERLWVRRDRDKDEREEERKSQESGSEGIAASGIVHGNRVAVPQRPRHRETGDYAAMRTRGRILSICAKM